MAPSRPSKVRPKYRISKNGQRNNSPRRNEHERMIRRPQRERHPMKPVMQFIVLTALAASVFTVPAYAGDAKAGDIVITQAWSRATPNGAKIAGGYLTIENKGTVPDRLVGGSGDLAGK